MKDYYIFKSGRISRKDNSIVLETNDGNIFIPINDIDSLCFFGEIDINTKAMNFLAQQQVVVHFFNYYGWYTGSFYPREFFLSCDVPVAQLKANLDMHSRTYIARQFVQGAIHGFITNIKRYPDVGDAAVNTLQQYINATEEQSNVLSLMGIEGNAHELYYSTFPVIIKQPIEFEKRVKHPPNNMMNALISFCNSLVYTHVIKELYKTQLNPTVSYLHEPSNRRFSLSLDVSEIFKPIYADRVIFDLLNNNMITQKHFDKDLNYCYLKEDGRKIVVKAFDDKINTTVMHKKLKRNVSYQKMIRLELYKLIKHLLNEEQYQSLRIWW